jgi:hypothetical protein
MNPTTHNAPPNSGLLQTSHTLTVGRPGLRQRGRLLGATQQKPERLGCRAIGTLNVKDIHGR